MVQSLAQEVQLTCPACSRRFDAKVWLLVDVAESPGLAERLRTGTLHDAPCPNCGHTGQVDAPLLLYRPDAEPCLLFSPAEQTSAEQDQEHAAGLL